MTLTKKEKLQIFSKLYILAENGVFNIYDKVALNKLIIENLGINGLKKVKKMSEKLTDCCRKQPKDCHCYDKLVKEEEDVKSINKREQY